MEPATAAEARRFGKYTLVAKLATGGMAEIFLARLHGDGGFEKLVCIKRILPHLAKDPQFVAMFLDEARVAARISHPNVCQVFELGEWNRQYYIAMEYLEGVPLSVFRRKDFYPQPTDPRLVAGFGVQACEGLHHAHQLKRSDGELLGVVHRDISPQNLFATTDGIIKVLDFGIAKVQDASVRTSTGAVKGTYAYMAPEQLRNERLDRRADVWAMGVVLWETLAQRHLFKRDTEFLTFEAITKLPIQDICEVRPDVPPLLGDTIARALARNPDDRYPSARALGEALGQAVSPLGGPLSPAAISDEVDQSFEAVLAEQRMLLRIAREGGQFDLESSSPLVGHGARLETTPISNIHQRATEAAEEVAQFAAANMAIESLDDDPRSRRAGSDGAFTPAPSRGARSQAYPTEDEIFDDAIVEDEVDPAPYGSRPYASPQRRSSPAIEAQRRSSVMAAQAERRSAMMAAQSERRSQAMAAQRRSQPYAVAPATWRHDETEPPLDTPLPVPRRNISEPAPMPRASSGSSLPWIIALISVFIAGGTGVMLYMKLTEKPAQSSSVAASDGNKIEMGTKPADNATKAEPGDKGDGDKGDGDEGKGDTKDKATDDKAPEGKADQADSAATGDEATDDRASDDKASNDKPSNDKTGEEATDGKATDGKATSATAKGTTAKGTKKTGGKQHKQVKGDTRKDEARGDIATNATKVDTKVDTKAGAGSGPPGFITIDSAPVYAVIYIDGKKWGETPLVNIKLSPGKHAVRAVSPSGATKNLSITIEPGKTAPPRKISW